MEQHEEDYESMELEKTGESPEQIFNYEELEEETRNFVKTRTAAIKALMKRTAQDIIEIGQELIGVKSRLGHGTFIAWLKMEFGWTRRTANNFIHVAERFKWENFSHLDFAPSALYLLASPSITEEARDEALSRAESGEAITHRVAKEIIEGQVIANLIHELSMMHEAGRISSKAAGQLARLDREGQRAIYEQLSAIDFAYQEQLEVTDAEAKRTREEYERQQATIRTLEDEIEELQQRIPTKPVLDEINRLTAELDAERAKPPTIEVQEKVPPDYEDLKRKVERFQERIDDVRNESSVKDETIQRLMKNLEKTQIELSQYDYKRKEMNAIHCLTDAHKLIGRARVQLDDPKGGMVVSERIEDLVAAIKRDLDSLSLVHKTIDIVEVD